MRTFLPVPRDLDPCLLITRITQWRQVSDKTGKGERQVRQYGGKEVGGGEGVGVSRSLPPHSVLFHSTPHSSLTANSTFSLQFHSTQHLHHRHYYTSFPLTFHISLKSVTSSTAPRPLPPFLRPSTTRRGEREEGRGARSAWPPERPLKI